MSDHDPPFERLRPLDPMAPDPKEDIGRLERIDPDNGDSVEVPPAGEASNSPRGPRDGLSVVIALAVLLSLSSIVAIGGLVAISMQTVAPAESTARAPVESSAPGPTIRVGEVAQGPDERKSDGREKQSPASGEPDPSPGIPTPVPDEGGTGTGGKGGNGDGKGGGGKGGGRGPGGAWCDARQGGSCDAVPGGVLQPVDPIVDASGADYEGDGYKPTDEDGDDVDEEDWDDDPSDHSGSGSSHPPGKR